MSNKRNDFTDALNEEMSARKILDKAKVVQSTEDKIFLSEFAAEKTFEPEIKKIESAKVSLEKNVPPAEKFSAEKNIPPVEKISLEKKSAPKKIVITKADFEKRVFAEADNKFFDEEVAEIGEHMRSKVAEKKNVPPIFHSKGLENISSESQEDKSLDLDFDLNRKLTRAEIAGIAISAIMLVYSLSALDKPLFFLAISLLSHLLRPIVGKFFGKYNRAVQNAMRSFSFVTFFGAILFIFM